MRLRNWQRRNRCYHLGDRTFEVSAYQDDENPGELLVSDMDIDITELRRIARMLADEPEALAWRLDRLEEAVQKIRTRLGI